jgi:uncharacterized protein YerC
MKRRQTDLSKEEVIKTLDALYSAASGIRGRKAMKMFLRDLLTPSERIMLGRRIIIARMLINGSLQEEISQRLRVGRSTIWRVQKWLFDQFPGYENAIKGMEVELGRRFYKEEKNDSLISKLKRKYPLHFLLFQK